MKINRINGFSLVEILISLLIISLILFIAIPAITMKMISIRKQNKEAGTYASFFYNNGNKTANLPCYVTETSGNTTKIVNENGNCEVSDFTVPNGVYKVDLTLVGGGGGGGGAAGGVEFIRTIEKTINDSTAETIFHAPMETVRNVRIDYLAGKGTDGSNYGFGESRNLTSGNGGENGNAIVPYNVKRGYLAGDYTTSFINDNMRLYITISKAYNNGNLVYLTAPTLSDIESNNGSGVVFTMKDSNNDGRVLGFYAADGNVSDEKAKIHCFSDILQNGATSNVTEGSYISSDSGMNNVCGLTYNNYELSGAWYSIGFESEGYEVPTGETHHSGYIVYGGRGKRIDRLNTDVGKGGEGGNLMLICPNDETKCTAPRNGLDNYTSTANARWQMIEHADKNGHLGGVKITTEHLFPGGRGAGGVGGAAVKIKNFSVRPGQRYRIVTGQGGKGGDAGKEGINNNGVTKVYSQTGTAGGGGTSTAIYDENNNLVVLVIGGSGGKGGYMNTYAQNATATNSLSQMWPTSPDKSANTQIVIIGKNYKDKITTDLFDTNIINLSEEIDEDDDLVEFADVFDDDYLKLKVGYKFLFDTATPMYELSTNKAMSGTNNGRTLDIDDVKTIGGFHYYINFGTWPANLTLSEKYNTISANTILYNGLYTRYLLNEDLLYPGGLGGFSGIGSKGGCGGLFVGNKEGLVSNGGSYTDYSKDSNAEDTIVVKVNGVTKAFNLNDYYSNCTTKTADGQTAKFEPPTFTSSSNSKTGLGQAGAGGGGGGWSSEFGAGNGGKGQDGYVFITWKI